MWTSPGPTLLMGETGQAHSGHQEATPLGRVCGGASCLSRWEETNQNTAELEASRDESSSSQ